VSWCEEIVAGDPLVEVFSNAMGSQDHASALFLSTFVSKAGRKMTEHEKDITKMLAEVIEMDEAELWEKRQLRFVDDLGVDSMLALEILALLEKKYRIQIPEENLLDLVSLQSTIDFVEQKLQQRVA
jgi:acyl carrier protein